MAFADGPARPRPRPRRAARAAAPASRASSGAVELAAGARAAARVRARAAAVPRRRTTAGARSAARTRSPSRAGVPVEIDGRDDARDVHGRARASRSASRCAGRAVESARARADRRPTQVAARIDDTVEGWRSWEAEHDIYDGPAPRARALQLARAEGPDLPARPARSSPRRRRSLPGDRRRRAQLGLPLRLDPRREPDARGALHRRLLRRGRGVRLVHDELGRRPRQRAARCRSCTGSAASTTSPSASCRTCAAGATRARCASATAPGTRPSSTSTASCSTRSHLYREQLGELHPGDPALRRRPRRHRGRGAGSETRRGHVGDARRAAPPPVLEGPVLDRARPRRQARAAARRARQASRRGRPSATAIREAILERGWSEKRAGLRAVVRLRRARRRALLMPIVGFLPADRPADALDDRGDRARPDRGRPRAALPQRGGPQRRRPDRRGGHVRDLLVLARLVPGPGRRGRARARRCSTSSSATPTTSACWPRRSTPRTASCSATSRRPSATSG